MSFWAQVVTIFVIEKSRVDHHVIPKPSVGSKIVLRKDNEGQNGTERVGSLFPGVKNRFLDAPRVGK